MVGLDGSVYAIDGYSGNQTVWTAAGAHAYPTRMNPNAGRLRRRHRRGASSPQDGEQLLASWSSTRVQPVYRTSSVDCGRPPASSYEISVAFSPDYLTV